MDSFLDGLLKNGFFRVIYKPGEDSKYYWVAKYFLDCNFYAEFVRAFTAYANEGYDLLPAFKIQDGELGLYVKDEKGKEVQIVTWEVGLQVGYESEFFVF